MCSGSFLYGDLYFIVNSLSRFTSIFQLESRSNCRVCYTLRWHILLIQVLWYGNFLNTQRAIPFSPLVKLKMLLQCSIVTKFSNSSDWKASILSTSVGVALKICQFLKLSFRFSLTFYFFCRFICALKIFFRSYSWYFPNSPFSLLDSDP